MNKLNIVIVRSRRKTISLHVLPSGIIEVRAPWFTPDFVIHLFVEKHNDWIEKNRKRVAPVSSKKAKKYVDGDMFWYEGKQYAIKIGEYKQIEWRHPQLFFPSFLLFRIQKELEDFYVKRAREVITQRVQIHAREMKTQYLSLMFSETKSKWGSCTPDNRLQFNWKLIMAPPLVLNYVVIHELAHTMIKNHSRDFWRLVEQYNPSYRQQRKWLKIHGNSLVI